MVNLAQQRSPFKNLFEESVPKIIARVHQKMTSKFEVIFWWKYECISAFPPNQIVPKVIISCCFIQPDVAVIELS